MPDIQTFRPVCHYLELIYIVNICNWFSTSFSSKNTCINNYMNHAFIGRNSIKFNWLAKMLWHWIEHLFYRSGATVFPFGLFLGYVIAVCICVLLCILLIQTIHCISRCVHNLSGTHGANTNSSPTVRNI